MDKRRFLLGTLAASALGPLAWPGARAQATAAAAPPLKIVLGTPAGGASDTAARLLGQALVRALGRQVVVDNRPGGNGAPAVQAVLAAPADGHTLLWTQASMAGMPMLVKSPPVKSMAEFVPVAPVVNMVFGLFVNPKVPATTVAELTTHLKAHPGQLSYGTGVLGEYMVAVHYLQSAGLTAVRVPYKGGAQLMPDLVSGELQFNFGPLAPALPFIRNGRLRLLATLPDAGEVVPGVPSLADAGISTDGMPTWNGLVAAPGTPPAVAARLGQEVERALDDPALRSALEAQGFRVAAGTPQQMGTMMQSAIATWRQFLREHDIPQE